MADGRGEDGLGLPCRRYTRAQRIQREIRDPNEAAAAQLLLEVEDSVPLSCPSLVETQKDLWVGALLRLKPSTLQGKFALDATKIGRCTIVELENAARFLWLHKRFQSRLAIHGRRTTKTTAKSGRLFLRPYRGPMVHVCRFREQKPWCRLLCFFMSCREAELAVIQRREVHRSGLC